MSDDLVVDGTTTDETGTTGPTAGSSDYSGPLGVSQAPVEFSTTSSSYTYSSTASTDTYVEVVFDREFDLSQYSFTVTDADGNDVTIDSTNKDGNAVVLGIASDLTDGATMSATDGNGDTFVDAAAITTTSTSIAEDTTAYSSDSVTAAYDGERIALISDETSESIDAFRYNSAGDVDNDFLFTRGTGTDSYVTVIDTGARDDLTAGEDYSFQFLGSSSDEERMTLRSLGLTAEATNTEISFTGDSTTVSADISSDAVNRDVTATLLDSSDEEVDSGTFTIDGDGQITADLTATEAGNYTIEVEDVGTGITTETDEISVSAVTGDVSFSETVFREDRGDVAEITIDLDNADSATVLIGGNSVSYAAAAEVTDAESGDDADGEVTLQFNTYLTNKGTPTGEGVFSAAGDDTATFVAADEVDSDITTDAATSAVLADTDYDLAAYIGGEESAVGTLIVEPRSTDSMNLWTAPSSTFGDAEAPADVYSAIEDGAVTQSDEIAAQDVLVHQIGASGVYGALQNELDKSSVSSQEAALVNLLTTDQVSQPAGETETLDTALSLSVVQTGSSPNQDPKRLALTDSVAAGAFNVVADADNETVFVNVKTDQLQFVRTDDVDPTNDYTDSETVTAAADEEFDVTFTVEQASGLTTAEDGESVSSTFTVVERAGMLNGGEDITVEAASGQEISGTTDIAPGTDVNIRARATGTSAFLKTATATVTENGTFATEFDFSGSSENTTFDVTASASPQFADGALSAEGTIGAAEATPTPTPTPEPATDTPTPEPATDTPTPEPATDTPTPEPATETPTDGGDTATETSGSQPGFGGAVAIVALAGAALIALRRGN
ncbi:BGTF surface domain-containing protein [Halosegnis longus]|uniref:BGTF surface domain-containing protein n=1 Tax=Halosegnis longus TaxID=2216012 RepID=UPI0018F7B412|nr:BGTF surface domain-containing protein [Halosegnis longus]